MPTSSPEQVALLIGIGCLLLLLVATALPWHRGPGMIEFPVVPLLDLTAAVSAGLALVW